MSVFIENMVEETLITSKTISEHETELFPGSFTLLLKGLTLNIQVLLCEELEPYEEVSVYVGVGSSD